MTRAFSILCLLVLLSGCSTREPEVAGGEIPSAETLAGGATTVFDESINAFSLPAANLSISRRDRFSIGNSFFRNPWVIAPSTTRARDGLGPLYNTNTCQSCHVKDGRGQLPAEGEPMVSALVRLSIPATTVAEPEIVQHDGIVPEPVYGGQLNTLAIPGISPEAQPRLHFQYTSGQFADGERYELRKPLLTIEEPAYGELHPQTMTSLRVAPAMIGLGLLEAIAEQDILAHADPEDSDHDSISGRPNRVWEIKSQRQVLGRFGWKAGQPSVRQQSAGAFDGDLGITSTLFPTQPCTEKQTICRQAPAGGEPEISDEILDFVAFYAKTLAVPARRRVEDDEVQHGRLLFEEARCALCHVPRYRTGRLEDFPELSMQEIHPYTDLLLHDMGEGLSDGRPEFEASGSEWRTPPLWGLGLVPVVNGHSFFLHDGRARNLMEAILWHSGEAEQSRLRVLSMNGQERTALLAFLNSL
ncbi:MAG TPA: di-heme oxidoredictase family protein [Gammaproteobacteria bacterium]|nr:di-heme oxidoredictase family protein [Gammaproteobacteria bacterium]